MGQFIKMPSINWTKLDSPKPIVAWSLLAQEISDKFFSGTLLAVPAIEEASYFDLMVCFSKISHFWQLTPTYRLLGHFMDISAPAKNEMELMEILRNPLKEDMNSTSFSYTWTDDNNNKSVTITMSGMSKYELNWNLKEGSLVLDCEKVIIDVQINKDSVIDRKIMKIDAGKIPVAFTYLKFPVDENGALLAANDTKLKTDAV